MGPGTLKARQPEEPGREDQEKPGEGEETRRKWSHGSREEQASEGGKVQIAQRDPGGKGGVSLDSANQRSLGIFVRRRRKAGNDRVSRSGWRGEGIGGSI